MGNLLQDNHRILFMLKKKKNQLSAAFKLMRFIFDVHRVPT